MPTKITSSYNSYDDYINNLNTQERLNIKDYLKRNPDFLNEIIVELRQDKIKKLIKK